MDDATVRDKPGIPVPVILASVFALVFCGLFSTLVFERVPHVHDEADYLFQARLFHSGRLYAPSPCLKEAFDFPHMINNGRWYSQYSPGFPLLLLLGLILGLPWLLNPVLAALSIILLYQLGREVYNRRVGQWAAVLGSVSPWFLVMSSTMMSHTSSLFFSTFFLLFLFRSVRRPDVFNGVLAGIGLGMALLIRPYNAVLMSFPFLIYYAFQFFKEVGIRWKNSLALILTFSLFVSILLLYNQLTNGQPFRMGYVVAYGQGVLPGLGRAAYPDLYLTPLRAADNIKEYLIALNSDLFQWPLSSFLAIIPLLWLGRSTPEYKKRDFLLFSGFLSLLIGYFFYWGTFLLLGARLIFECAVPLFLLSARGISQLPVLFKRISRRQIEAFVSPVLAIFVLNAFLLRLPRWVWPKDTKNPYETIGRDFAGTTRRIHSILQSLDLKNALIILNLQSSAPTHFQTGGWGSGFIFNDPDLKSNIIYARAKGKDIQRLLDCYSQRNVFLYFGTLEKGMVLPLEERTQAIQMGEPLRSSSQFRNSIQLLQDPSDIFFIYSPEFGAFIKSVLDTQGLADLNGKRLQELGVDHQVRGEFPQAAFCFEAALQVEAYPDIRLALLNHLTLCYQKTSQAEAARRGTAFMEKVGFNERKLYDVFPERGF
jgi:Dolichyl-phosphate-mannose-protein mannosyltransferase